MAQKQRDQHGDQADQHENYQHSDCGVGMQADLGIELAS
jgi:hypothetical protein